MFFLSTQIASRMTLDVLLLLLLTLIAIYTVMALAGKPKLVSPPGRAPRGNRLALARQLAIPLSRIESTTAAMAHVAEAMPTDVALADSTLRRLIDAQGDPAIAGG